MQKKRVEWLIYAVTWSVVLLTSFTYWYNDDPEFQLPMDVVNVVFVLLMFVGFGLGMHFILRAQYCKDRSIQQRDQTIGFALSLLCFCALATVIYYLILGLLFAAFVSTFVHYLKPRWAWTLALSAPLIAGSYDVVCKGIPFYFTTKLLFVSFNCIVLQFGFRAESERRARQQSEQLLRELSATQSLLESTAKRDERMRIARDIHDVMGHNLTALSLQLELASHLEGDAVQEKISVAKTLSKDALQQVRENVREFRASSKIALSEAIRALVDNLPTLTVDLHLDFDENGVTTRQAEVVFRCIQESITNVLKHSHADQCQIRLIASNQLLHLTVQDNGGKDGQCFKAGGGMLGMQERVQLIDGNVVFNVNERGMCIEMTIPLHLVC